VSSECSSWQYEEASGQPASAGGFEMFRRLGGFAFTRRKIQWLNHMKERVLYQSSSSVCCKLPREQEAASPCPKS
jgi:hypothetical protein